MKLKLTRSQRQGGVISTATIFCLDARVELTAEELASVNKYKMGSQVLYNSEASKRLLDKGNASGDGSFTGGLKQMGFAALALMRLNITINGLQRGQHIECKDLDEVLGAEEALMTACRNLKGYLDTANSFDGREVLFDFSGGDPKEIAPRPDAVFSTPSAPPPPAIETSYSPPPQQAVDVDPSTPAIPSLQETEFYENSDPAMYRSTTAEPDADVVARLSDWWGGLALPQRLLVIGAGVLALLFLRSVL